MAKEFESRFDIRVDTSLKEQFKKVCEENNQTLSEGVRNALDIFICFKPFVNSLIESLQNPLYFTAFYTFYNSVPFSVKKTFDALLWPEEEKMLKKTPKQLLKSINVVTEKGREMLKELYGTNLKLMDEEGL
jgi:hypothetical protein